MRKQPFIFLFILAMAFLPVIGCHKDKSSTTPPAPTNTQLLTQAPWKFDHATASGIDISSQINACYKDNIATFAANGTMTIDEGANVCSPSTAGPYTWAFQSNETVLHLSAPIFSGGSSDFTIVSLTSTNLVVSQVMTVPPNPPTTVVVTFKH